MDNKKFLLGVISGMGPRVLIPFCNKLINLNIVNKEQDHVPFMVISDPTIEDRTTAILNGNTDNVLKKLNSILKKFNLCGVTHVFMLCNTVHYWKPLIDIGDMQVIDIIESTKIFVNERNLRKILLLSTKGTYQTKLYNKYFSNNLIIPDDTFQDQLMDIIYDCKKGVDNLDKLKDLIYKLSQKYDFKGLILGCTELSLLLQDITKINGKEIFDPILLSAVKIINIYKNK